MFVPPVTFWGAPLILNNHRHSTVYNSHVNNRGV